MVDCRNRVLPRQAFFWNERAEITRDRAHVAMRQLVPGAGKRVGELVRMLKEAARNLLVRWIEPQREVRGQHGRRATLGRIVRIGYGALACAILRPPLIRAGWALGKFPVIVEKILEVVVAPLGGRRAPDYFQAAGDGVAGFA